MRSLVAYAVMVGVALAGPGARPAFAKTDPRETEARTKCLAGDVERGAALLAELYVETRQATYIYNQARCYQQNGRPGPAVQRFREYLRTERDVSAEERQRVEGYIRELEAEQARTQPPAFTPGPAATPPATPPAPPVETTPNAPGLPELTPPPPPVGPADPGVDLGARAEPGVSPRSWQRTAAYVAGGAAVVSLGAAVGSHVLREQRADAFNQACFPNVVDGCAQQESGVKRASTVAVVGYAAAALLGGGAVYLFLTSPETSPRATARRGGLCAPAWPAGVLCSARF